MTVPKVTKNTVKIPAQPIENRFLFPFKGDSYRYSNNAEALNPPFLLDITPEYEEEIAKKRALLQTVNQQAYQSFPHTLDAQWEILEMIIEEMVSQFPNYFSVSKRANEWIFYNHILGEKQAFTFGDATSLPYEPLDFIGRHIQEDVVYLSQRDGELYMDAGQLCFPANWSIAFNLGMTYMEFHSPVPSFSTSGLAEKVRNFIMRMETGKPWTRLNWTITVEKILDTFPENFDEWGAKKDLITSENVGKLVHLRVEHQKLFRLPGSNGILFSIHTHLISLEDLSKKDEWVQRFYRVLSDLPDYIAEYKGFISYKEHVLTYLQNMMKEVEIK